MADLTQLDPGLLPIAQEFLKTFPNAKITVTYRDGATQDQCKAEGLSNASAGQSAHNCTDAQGNPCSRAFDFACFDNGQYITDGINDAYTICGEWLEQQGLTWGGRWHHPDFDHAEIPEWQTASE